MIVASSTEDDNGSRTKMASGALVDQAGGKGIGLGDRRACFRLKAPIVRNMVRRQCRRGSARVVKVAGGRKGANRGDRALDVADPAPRLKQWVRGSRPVNSAVSTTLVCNCQRTCRRRYAGGHGKKVVSH